MNVFLLVLFLFVFWVIDRTLIKIGGELWKIHAELKRIANQGDERSGEKIRRIEQ